MPDATNGAYLAAPLGLVFLAALPVIWWLHRRRRRPPPVVVPSLSPWQALLPAAAHARRTVPPTVLLVLHLAVAAFLAVALADPRLPGARTDTRDRAVVLDTTTSMVAATRWTAAVARARELARVTPGEFTLVALDARPRVVVARETDSGATESAIAGLVPAGTGDRVDEALVLAAAVAGPRAVLHLITDGAITASGRDAPEATWELVGVPEDNRAIVHAAARRLDTETRLFARVANYAAGSAAASLSLRLDGQTRDTRPVRLPPGGSVETVWSLPPDAQVAELILDGTDVLPADDVALVPLVRTGPVVQWLGESPAVERVLECLSDAEVTHPGLGSFVVDGSVDVTVLVGIVPDPVPPGGVVLFDPPPGAFSAGGPAVVTDAGAVASDHPIAWGLDLAGTRVSYRGMPDLSAWAEPVLTVDGTVVGVAGELDGARTVVFGFQPDEGGLASRLAFPMLVARAVEWAGGAGDVRRATIPLGDSLALPMAAMVVDGPDGVRRNGWGGIDRLVLPGLYRVGIGENGRRPMVFAAMAGDVRESDLRRRAEAPKAPGSAGSIGVAGTPLWPWFVALALLCVIVEGVWRTRRGRQTGRGRTG